MKYRPFSIRMGEEEFAKLTKVAQMQGTTPSALARLFLYEGVNRFDTRAQQIQEKLDFLIELLTTNNHLSAGAVAAAAIHNSKKLERKSAESVDDYHVRYFADLKENIRASKKLGVQIQKAFKQADY